MTSYAPWRNAPTSWWRTGHPGYLAGLGLGFEKLRELNPSPCLRLNHALRPDRPPLPLPRRRPHIPGRVWHDDCQRRRRYARPCMAPYEITAQVGCVQAAFGALLAIRSRRTTGQGQHVDLSLQEATISAEHPYIYRYSHENVITRREGRHSPFGAVNTYLCADGNVRQHFRVQRRPLRPAGQGHYGASHTLGGCLDEPDGPPRKPGAHRHSA